MARLRNRNPHAAALRLRAGNAHVAITIDTRVKRIDSRRLYKRKSKHRKHDYEQ